MEDVACVRFYRTIRENVPATARRLSVGRNLYPPSAALKRHLNVLMEELNRTNRFAEYESDADRRERSLVAGLLGRYLERPEITADDVFFTHGAQEAISLVCGFGAASGLAALLPLPLYYSLEQSSRRWGMPIAGHYRHDGETLWHGCPHQRLLEALIVPNGVTGTLFQRPAAAGGLSGREVDVTLIDCVFQLGAFDAPGRLAESTREIVRDFDLESTALVFTASKDLSLPGLRAGLLVTRNRDLLRHARADRFERLYAPNPLLGQLTALYLALLLLNERRGRSGTADPDLHAELDAAFRAAGGALPAAAEAAAVLASFDAMTDRCRRNLALVTGGGLPLELDRRSSPVAGYSVFPRLAAEFTGSADFVAWIRHAGVDHGLKLNPSYLFGAGPETWEALYPGEYRIRLNVSDEPGELALTLARLETAVTQRQRVAVS